MLIFSSPTPKMSKNIKILDDYFEKIRKKLSMEFFVDLREKMIKFLLGVI